MTRDQIFLALRHGWKGKEFNFDLSKDDISGLDWIGPGDAPTVQQIETALIDGVKVQQWAAIKSTRDRRTQIGGYKVGTKWYHSDTFSRTQQMGLVMLGSNLPAGIQWKTMDGTFVTMTQALAGQIFGAAAASDIALFAAAEAHKTAMEASTDPAAYDYLAGWPAIFGE